MRHDGKEAGRQAPLAQAANSNGAAKYLFQLKRPDQHKYTYINN